MWRTRWGTVGAVVGLALIVGIGIGASTSTDDIRILINGKPVKTDVAVRVVGGRLIGPIAPVARAMGARVKWDPEHRTLRITFNAVPEKQATFLSHASSQEPILRKVEWSVPLGQRYTWAPVRSVGDMNLRIRPLGIMSVRTLGKVSSHFADGPMAEQEAFMYAGTSTAAIPMTARPLTLFWVVSDNIDAGVVLHPEKASLLDTLGNELTPVEGERIYASCPPWDWPGWRQQHNVTGFLVFPRLDDNCTKVTLRLPYSREGEERTALWEFERRVLQEDVPRNGF